MIFLSKPPLLYDIRDFLFPRFITEGSHVKKGVNNVESYPKKPCIWDVHTILDPLDSIMVSTGLGWLEVWGWVKTGYPKMGLFLLLKQ